MTQSRGLVHPDRSVESTGPAGSAYHRIEVYGCLDLDWDEWFEGLDLRHTDYATTILEGELVDQAALFGTLIKIRDLNAIALPERRLVQQLVSGDNVDRAALYEEIARANGHPEWKTDIQATFAKGWVSNAPAGWWYQDSRGQWVRK